MFSILRHHPRALLWALAVHVVFLVIFGVSFTFFKPRTLPLQDSDIIRAVTIDPVDVQQKIEHKKAVEKKQQEDRKKAAQERKKAELEKKAQEAEKKKLIALKKQEAKKKKAEQKRLAEEKKKKEAELKKKLEAEARLREEQQQREAELKKEMAAEQAKLAAERRKQQITIRDKYLALINAEIQKNWRIPTVAKPDMVCKIKVQLIPSGEVINMRIVSSSGNAVFDHSVEVAVKKSSPLPLPAAEYGLFDEFRELNLNFSPQDKKS